MTSVAVIGAGVAGLTVATVLAERGAEVAVVDRSPGLGPDQCSWYAGGMLAPWCERENAEAEVVALGQGAADFWAARVPGVVRRGSLVIAPARDSGELRRFARRT
ncbi:MAG: FAD-dependent oxidoreductase, partial [Rhodospirillaceae bacterium]|nr:FAD-dependent oxidoreductase [Rhodospirillaceae bacterium]